MRSAKQVIAKVRELGANAPENKYVSNNGFTICYYHIGKCTNGSTGCIVGQALMELGWVSQYDLLFYAHEYRLYTDEHLIFNDTTNITSLFKKLLIDCQGNELQWLARVQDKQDRGSTWGEAIKNADYSYPQ